MSKITNEIGNEGLKTNLSNKCACVICGTNKNLKMIAHRNDESDICGWIFVCLNDSDYLENNHGLELYDLA